VTPAQDPRGSDKHTFLEIEAATGKRRIVCEVCLFTDGRFPTRIRVSPNGRVIACRVEGDGAGMAPALLDIDSGELTIVHEANAQTGMEPTWLPDGSGLLYGTSYSAQISRIDVADLSVHPLGLFEGKRLGHHLTFADLWIPPTR
jgi:hypothetical protein